MTWGATPEMITITYISYVQPVLDYGRELLSTASDNVCNALRLITGAAKFLSLQYRSKPKWNLLIFIIIIGIRPLGRSGQRPEFSQATGMALVRCILGKFLGVACHCLCNKTIKIFVPDVPLLYFFSTIRAQSDVFHQDNSRA